MKKNGLLQTFFFTIFWKFKWQIMDHLKKWKRAHQQYMVPRFFYQKGHGAAPFYFSLDKTLSKQVTLYGPWPGFLYYNPIPSYIHTTSIKFVQNLQNCHKKLFHFIYLHQINVLSQYVHQFSYSLFIFMS